MTTIYHVLQFRPMRAKSCIHGFSRILPLAFITGLGSRLRVVGVVTPARPASRARTSAHPPPVKTLAPFAWHRSHATRAAPPRSPGAAARLGARHDRRLQPNSPPKRAGPAAAADASMCMPQLLPRWRGAAHPGCLYSGRIGRRSSDHENGRYRHRTHTHPARRRHPPEDPPAGLALAAQFLAQAGANLLIETLPRLYGSDSSSPAQDKTPIPTYAPMLKKKRDGWISHSPPPYWPTACALSTPGPARSCHGPEAP